MATNSKVVDRYADILDQMSVAARRALLEMWDALPNISIARADDWYDIAQPTVGQLAQAALDVTVSMAEQLGLTGTPSDLIVPDASARLYEPFDRIAHLVKQGKVGGIGASARSVAEELAHDTVYRTARQTVASIASDQNTRWVRRATGSSCSWCLTMTQYDYRTAEKASFGHPKCDCIPVPAELIGDHNTNIIAARGLDPSALNEKKYDDQHRRQLKQSAATADRRRRQAADELKTETNPGRITRLERRANDWQVRGDRARERIANLGE